MKLLDLDSSATARKNLAEELHYQGDMKKSAKMNVWLRVMSALPPMTDIYQRGMHVCLVPKPTSMPRYPAKHPLGSESERQVPPFPSERSEFLRLLPPTLSPFLLRPWLWRKDEKNITVLKSRFASLTAREKEILGFVTSGLLNKQIAAELSISVVTVKMHRGNIMRKMRARSLADLVRMADLLGVSRTKPTAPRPKSTFLRPSKTPPLAQHLVVNQEEDREV